MNLQVRERELIVGDLNAHHPLWDKHLSDERGKELADSIITQNLNLLNDGRHTRADPGNGALTSPDISLCRGDIDAEWEVEDGLNSDHSPILITVHQKGNVPKAKGRIFWD